MVLKTRVLLDGLAFGESPRWHDGRLWFSDMHAHQVMAVDLSGRTETIARVPGQPSGLGWLPDGRLLVVSMIDRRLLRLDPGGLVEVTDLHALASGLCNDMVVDSQGRAYIGHSGFDLYASQPSALADIILVMPDGDARVVAKQIAFPNGTVITPDGRTLIVAESFGSCLTAFDIQSNGSLMGRRLWASTAPAGPDGICLDAEGAIWIASPRTREVLRIREGGQIDKRISLSKSAFACMLGGPDRRTLFILTADSFLPDEARVRLSGRVEFVEVDVPGAGLP
jgi:sugar lactone lactonase YvrE